MKLGGVSIRAIGAAKAGVRIDNVAQAAAFGRDEDFLGKRIGAASLPMAAPEETACALGAAAATQAIDESGLCAAKMGLLIFVTQNPDFGGLPHNSAVLQAELGLPTSAICFDVGLGCSGYVYALSIAASMMKTAQVKHALVVTSDQYRAHLGRDDVNTRLLFGDAACATVLSTEGGELEVKAARLGTDGSGCEALIRRAGVIEMNGRAVFSFSRKRVPDEIAAFVEENGFALASVDAFLLHQGSRAIVEEIAQRLRVDRDKAPIEMEALGNTVSSSLPFLLRPRLANPRAKRIVAAGFGVGLSWGMLWLERRGGHG